MSAATEEWADWCESEGGVAFSGTRMREHSRRSMGERWCFHCRQRHEFLWIVMMPDGLSYYGPSVVIEGIKADCTDLFPGWSREWDD